MISSKIPEDNPYGFCEIVHHNLRREDVWMDDIVGEELYSAKKTDL